MSSRCASPDSARPSPTCWSRSTSSAPRRRSTRVLRERGNTIGLATVYRTLQLLAEHDEVDVIAVERGRGRLPPVLRHPSPPPGVPLVRRDGRGGGSGRGAVDPRDRRRARVRRGQPHPGDLRRLPALPLRASGDGAATSQREPHPEHAAVPELAVDLDPAAVALDDRLGDARARGPRPGCCCSSALLGPEEAGEQPVPVGGLDADAGVARRPARPARRRGASRTVTRPPRGCT